MAVCSCVLQLLAFMTSHAITHGSSCSTLILKSPLKTLDKVSGEIKHNHWIGLYNLQFAEYDHMPTYLQHSYLCRKQVEGKPVESWSNKDLSCTNDGSKYSKMQLFYDSMRNQWKIATKLGGQPLVFSPQAVAFPQRIANTSWKAFNDDTGDIDSIDSLGISCCTTCVQPFKDPAEKHKYETTKPLDREEDSKCLGECAPHPLRIYTLPTCLLCGPTTLGWHKTAGCDPRGLLEPDQNKGCNANITAKLSGFCQCASGRKHQVACGHSTFTCAQACQIEFPIVYAVSGERVWTSQYARNLLKFDGTWLSPSNKNQWVNVDLGTVNHVHKVVLTMFGSYANPKSCAIKRGGKPSSDWHVINRFKTAQFATR
jgi:hypothetical protein